MSWSLMLRYYVYCGKSLNPLAATPERGVNIAAQVAINRIPGVSVDRAGSPCHRVSLEDLAVGSISGTDTIPCFPADI